MDWFIAKIVFRIVCGDGNHRAQFDEQLRLIAAPDRQAALAKATALGEKVQERFLNQHQQWVNWEFIYLEADDDFVKIHTEHGVYLKNRTMGHFEAVLDNRQFVRVHRSYLVQVARITRIDPYQKETFTAVLRSGARIPVSQAGYTRLREVLGM